MENNYFFIFFILILILFEIIIYLLVLSLKKNFQWLITKRDEKASIPESLIKKFIKDSYHEKLGWDRKANTSKKEVVKGIGEQNIYAGITEYNINSNSERYNPGHSKLSKKIITYGDSYAFCRHVNDNETWQWFLSERTNTNVVNRGVGNYGLDQAYLKMRDTINSYKDTAEIAIIGVVPETIVRIVNVWKHFYEHGNILGFKGRYLYKDKKLIWNNCLAKEIFVDGNKEWHEKVKKIDYCYEHKFMHDLITFPYSLSLMFNYQRNGKIIYYLLKKQIMKLCNIENNNQNEAWNHAMKCNHNFSKSLYKNTDIVNLLRAIISQYSSTAKAFGLKPVLLFIPYLEDIKHEKSSKLYYSEALAEINEQIILIDMGEVFLKEKNINRLYVSESVGAHLSKAGNKIVSETIGTRLDL